MIEKVLICLFSTFQNAWKREFGCLFITDGKSSWWYRQRSIQGSRCSQPEFSGSCPAVISATSAPGPTAFSGSPTTWDCRTQGEVSQECCHPCLVMMWRRPSHSIANSVLLCLKSSLGGRYCRVVLFFASGENDREVGQFLMRWNGVSDDSMYLSRVYSWLFISFPIQT